MYTEEDMHIEEYMRAAGYMYGGAGIYGEEDPKFCHIFPQSLCGLCGDSMIQGEGFISSKGCPSLPCTGVSPPSPDPLRVQYSATMVQPDSRM